MHYRIHYTVKGLDYYVEVKASDEYDATTKAYQYIIENTPPTICETDITIDAIENLSIAVSVQDGKFNGEDE